MPTLKELEKSAESVFTKIRSLQEQLRGIPNARATFSIENGMEYCTNAELGSALARAAKKSPLLKGNQASKNLDDLANTLEKCTKNLKECETVVARAAHEHSWTPGLEEKMFANWQLFGMNFLDAATTLDVKELDFFMLIGKPEVSANKKQDADAHSIKTASDQSWHSKGSFIRMFQSKTPRNKIKLSKQQTGNSNQSRPTNLPPPNVPDNSDAASDPGPSSAPDMKKDPRYLNPSVRSSSPPPQYSDIPFTPSMKKSSPVPQTVEPVRPAVPVRPAQDPQGPLSRFSSRFDAVPAPQPGGQTFIAEHIHMYHGCPPAAAAAPYPGYPPGAPHMAAWQPVWQPPPPGPPGPPLLVPPPPSSYKSTRFSLRETLATEFLDLIKPDASCVHGVRHFKNHPACGWGCCWQRGCYGGY